jgi:hypothetical protein
MRIAELPIRIGMAHRGPHPDERISYLQLQERFPCIIGTMALVVRYISAARMSMEGLSGDLGGSGPGRSPRSARSELTPGEGENKRVVRVWTLYMPVIMGQMGINPSASKREYDLCQRSD